ncbi:MAG: alpha/beta fold hydrolase [Rhodospirillales bacterium]|nr:alpha/beta fold hydrolase [Rhodospirillales bacterium]
MSVALAFRETGDGPPLVILHGLFGSGQNWQSIARRLGDSHRVIAVDLRNHGGSPSADAMTFSEMVDDLRVLLEDRGIERTALLGHSVGGKTAMVFALLYGQMVDSLIVVDIAPVPYDHTFLPLVRAMQRLDLSGGLPRAALEKRLARDISDKPLRTFLMQNLVNDQGQASWRINLDAIGAHMAGLTGFPDVEGFVYDGRALFVSGAQSDYLGPQHHERIRELFPWAEFATIADAGHRVHAEQPERFLGVVRQFLSPAT